MPSSYFLWPAAKPLRCDDWISWHSSTASRVEETIAALYPGTYPVLFSSARAGLTAVLLELQLGRPSLCWAPAYSSHCVLEAIAHVCTPTPVVTDDLSAALVVHQWGVVHAPDFSPAVRLIEDAVDTLFLPNASVFSTNSQFVLWSPPKVLATQGGGVVFCRRPEAAVRLRATRDMRGTAWIQAWLRARATRSVRASLYWNGAEAMQGHLPNPHRHQLFCQLNRLESLAHERLAVLQAICPSVAQVAKQLGRVPSNLPVRIPLHAGQGFAAPPTLMAGLRNFNRLRSWPLADWQRVVVLPVHMDMTVDTLRHTISSFISNQSGVLNESDIV